MQRKSLTSCVVLALVLLGSCNAPAEVDGAGPMPIASADEASVAFVAVSSAISEIDQRVATDFTAPLSLDGVTGTAQIQGRKTSTTTSSPSSFASTSLTDIHVSFDEYENLRGSKVTGTTRWFEYADSRSSCSDDSCDSDSNRSSLIEGSSLSVAFSYSGRTYEDVITLFANKHATHSGWDVLVTNRAGTTYRFTY